MQLCKFGYIILISSLMVSGDLTRIKGKALACFALSSNVTL